MSKPAKKHVRFTASAACAVIFALSVDPRWAPPGPPAEIQHDPESHVLLQELGVLAYFPHGTPLWPH